ncbi:MAG: hypothetical protein ACIAXF_05590 [Phycisphaerales bacterium JB063]
MNRPRVLIVFGVINLLFAVGWIFSGFSSLVLLAFSPEFYTDNNPMGVDTAPILATYAALESPVFKGYWIANGVFAILAGGLVGVAGVGLLMARAWGRRLSLIWAAIAVLGVAVSVGMTNGYFVPAYASQMNEALPSSAERGTAITLSLILRWAYPVVLLVLLPRPNITAIFEAAKHRRAAPGQTLHTPQSPGRSPAPAPQAPSASAPPAAPTQAPAPSPPAQQRTWRDDPWNDPSAT